MANLINMVFGYKHAPRPTRSEDAALSIAFGRPAFHSRQVFSQLNNLARNQAFAQLLDKQGREGERGSVGSSTIASGLQILEVLQTMHRQHHHNQLLSTHTNDVDSLVGTALLTLSIMHREEEEE